MRKPRRSYTGWLVLLAVFALAGLGLFLAVRVTNEQTNDAFCLSCHTIPERVYFDRAEAATAGALAVDLASFHYQTLRGQDSIIHCIECHRGDGSFSHRIDVLTVSTRHALEWLIGRNDSAIEKLYTTAPHLSNDSCLGCHAKTLLVAGMANHWHNMLPATHELWRTGASVIPPAGTVDKQAVIAAGLLKYESDVLCSDCHQTHAALNESSGAKSGLSDVPAEVGARLESAGAALAMGPSTGIRQAFATHLDTDQYMDKQISVPEKCVQCHREVGKGPLQVTVP